jgi:hypothetical protein
MANVLKVNPVGIDVRINEVQTFMYNSLLTTWNLNANTLNVFGRAYRNQTKDGYIPEVFTGGKDYRDTFIDDKVSATCFFGLSETVKSSEGYNTAPVFLIVMCDLSKIKPPIGRQDEEAKLDVQKIFNKYLNGFKVISFQTGLDTVFSDYNGWRKKDGIKYRDTHPLYCFRVNFEVTYKI